MKEKNLPIRFSRPLSSIVITYVFLRFASARKLHRQLFHNDAINHRDITGDWGKMFGIKYVQVLCTRSRAHTYMCVERDKERESELVNWRNRHCIRDCSVYDKFHADCQRDTLELIYETNKSFYA